MFGVNFQHSFFIFRLPGLQVSSSFFQNFIYFLWRKLPALDADDLQHTGRNVNTDQVILFHKGNRATVSGFRRNMADSRAFGGA